LTDLPNLALFAKAIAKVLVGTGIGPGILIAFIAGSVRRMAPVLKGRTYRVVGYYTGDFIGECVGVDRTVARFVVIDPLRRIPKVRTRCPFPECVGKEFHDGDHEFADPCRKEAVLEVVWRNASFNEAA